MLGVDRRGAVTFDVGLAVVDEVEEIAAFKVWGVVECQAGGRSGRQMTHPVPVRRHGGAPKEPTRVRVCSEESTVLGSQICNGSGD
jgi:hypothetical protein